MNKKLVKFFLPSKNFQRSRTSNGFTIDAMMKVCTKSFGANLRSEMMSNEDGFWIVCRPDQFARFIIYRAGIGTGVNGIRCLEARLFTPVHRDALREVANHFELSYEKMGEICEYFSVDPECKVFKDAEMLVDVSEFTLLKDR